VLPSGSQRRGYEIFAHGHKIDQGRLVREPMWQIFEGPGAPKGLGCANLIRTLVYDRHDPEDVDSDSEDHAPDTARYGLMTRVRPTVTPLDVMPSEYACATLRAEHDERDRGQSSNFYADLD
jgi:hypothetical protein